MQVQGAFSQGTVGYTFKTEMSHCLAIGYETGFQTSLWILVCVHSNTVMTSLLCEKNLHKILRINKYILFHKKKIETPNFLQT